MRPEQIDSYRRDWSAVVRRVEPDGDAAWLRLEPSFFYPTAGGQPHDAGVLTHAGGEARVVDVVADGPEAVRLRATGALPAEGASVEARLDWPRRFRHMTRHSAQHLLSQAFLHVAPRFETRAVSLASADATLDLAGEPDDDAVREAFELARAWCWAALPVEAFEVDERELAAYSLRRPPKVRGRIRLVRMGEVELSACGGTHLRSTAEALPLLALRRGRVRGGLTRVTFRAGPEASEAAQAAWDLTQALALPFSARPEELPERIEALREEARTAARRADAAVAEAARLRVAAALAAASDLAGRPLVELTADDPDALPALAEAVAEAAPDALALLGARTPERAALLFRRAPGDGPDLRAALAAALPHVAGRGGGRPDRVQGAGTEPAGLAAALAAARAALR